MKKILLSLLTVFSFAFLSTNIVNAESTDQANDTAASENTNATTDSTQTPSDTTQIPADTTQKKLSDITQEEFNSIIPDAIKVNTTKTAYADFLVENMGMTDNTAVDPVATELKNIVATYVSAKGYIVESDDLEISSEAYNGEGKMEQAYIILKNGKIYKDITIEFARESNFSEADKAYVEKKLSEIKFDKFEGSDAVFTVYNLGDEKNANKWDIDTYDFTKLFNDKSITTKVTYGVGGFGGGTPWGTGTIVYLYKNDVFYASKFIMNIGMYGTVLDNGTAVNIGTLDKDDINYKGMTEELKKQGYKNIIGFYEATAYGKVDGKTKVSFTVDSKYNGKNVKVLHKLKSGKYETLKSTVKDGKVTVTVSEFSPFMIAIDDKAPNNAQTSSMNVSLYSILLLSSIAGIIIVSKKKIA